MKKHFWAIGLAFFAAVLGVAVASATGDGDESADDTADNVFLGEQDLAERMEIWRNQFRRMTPGDAPLVQDVGTWPAAWEEFSHAWAVAPAERDLATWLVPVTAARSGALTVLRDANGTLLWSAATDFAKDESASVTLTGLLVDEEEWPLYEAAREEVERRYAEAFSPVYPGGMRGTNGPYTNGLRFTDISVDTNGDYRLDFAWETNGDVQVFCRAMHYECWTNFGVVATNDENQVVTNDVVNWRQVPGEKFMGIPDYWESLGVTTVTNGEGSFTDTNHANPLFDRVRFYAAAQYADTDNDGLTDGEEWLWGVASPTDDSDDDGLPDYLEWSIYHTAPYNPDTDGDGWTDGEETQAQTDPLNRLSAPRLARGVLVYAVKYAGEVSNQWVQLHCSGPRSVNVSGFRLQASGTSWETVATLPEDTWMTPGHFLLIGDTGVTNADLTAALELANVNTNQTTAGVRLVPPADSTNGPVDTMFYGTHMPFNAQNLDDTGWLSETTNLWASATRHLERWYLGLDTDRENDWRHIADGDVYNAEAILDWDCDDLMDEDEYLSGFNPLDPDMDNDGLLDGFELGAGLSPINADTDGNGTQDGDEESPVPGQSYDALQQARDLTATVIYPTGWAQGDDLGLNGLVSFKLENITGFAAVGSIWEGGNVAENYTVDVNGAASYRLWTRTLPGGFKTVKMFAVPNGTNAITVTVVDGGPNPNVTSPEEMGADIHAAFCSMKLDVEINGVGEDSEVNPGVFIENWAASDGIPNAYGKFSVFPRPPQWLSGMLSLTWDSDILNIYQEDGWGSWSLLSPPLTVPLAGFKTMNLLVHGLESTDTDVIGRWQNRVEGQDVVHVVCYEVNASLSDNMPCDGEEVFVTLEILPLCVEAMYQGAEWTIEASGGGQSFNNPSGLGIELEPVPGNDKQWKIPNARWFAADGCLCEKTAYYNLSAICDFDVFSHNAKAELPVSVACFDGNFSATNFWTGTIVVNTAPTSNGMWAATVSLGTFHRDITGFITNTAPTNSQFYTMISAEENAHAWQHSNPGSPIIQDLWNIQNIISNCNSQSPFVSTNLESARAMATNAFRYWRDQENERSLGVANDRKCALELEAKTMAGSSHCLILDCTYPECQNQNSLE